MNFEEKAENMQQSIDELELHIVQDGKASLSLSQGTSAQILIPLTLFLNPQHGQCNGCLAVWTSEDDICSKEAYVFQSPGHYVTRTRGASTDRPRFYFRPS